MKIHIPIIIIALAGTLVSCGPSDAELRAELQSIDREMMELQSAAYRFQSEMDQAEFSAFINSFAVGYGAVSGDYALAGEGAGGAYNAVSHHDASSYSLGQIRNRQQALVQRRQKIIKDLN